MFEAVFLLCLVYKLNDLLLKHRRLCMKLNTSKLVRGSMASGYITVPPTTAEEDNDWSVTNVSQRDRSTAPTFARFGPLLHDTSAAVMKCYYCLPLDRYEPYFIFILHSRT
jgi:hypothetical protein